MRSFSHVSHAPFLLVQGQLRVPRIAVRHNEIHVHRIPIDGQALAAEPVDVAEVSPGWDVVWAEGTEVVHDSCRPFRRSRPAATRGVLQSVPVGSIATAVSGALERAPRPTLREHLYG